jgi:DNA mismatch endonuclease (patch repair protein)
VALTVGERMALVRVKNTEPELRVRNLLSAKGVRYRLHRRDLPGKPDLYIARLRLAVFVNGCFWHGHKDCPRAVLPKTNTTFWGEKIGNNVARDERTLSALRNLGIETLTLWTCDQARLEKACAGICRKWAQATRR